MKNLTKNILAATVFIFAIASPVMALSSPQTVSAASCDGRFLGIPPWYRGLTNDDCSLRGPNDFGDNGIQKYILKIALNIVEMAIVIVAYIALFFILYGGFLYLTGGANPSQIEKARKTILDAVIGLVIAMGSIALVNLIFSII
ncbi:MAG: hypothetical protein WAR37_02415 [Candidatus Microsaccharimonas sp.]